ncbi:MAG TPA: cation diffusion facilitator family transporter [Thermomicrobiales bacterium]|nr:cation diffusion facilitator family transporter [Thermomicrobiales bacterium]
MDQAFPDAHKTRDTAQREKQRVALLSILGAVALTTLKLAVGIVTGSLGILAEAAHSTLDMVASVLTFFAVRLAGQPPDAEHRYGHGKAENLAAFVEALLLLLTVAWIAYEAVRRLFAATVHVEATIWAPAVMVVSIAVDFARSRALGRTAREHGSQALAADALNFKTDMLSSAVVLVALLVLVIGRRTGWDAGGWLPKADALAALVVAAIVLTLAGRMLREAVDVLLDRAPEERAGPLVAATRGVPGVLDLRRLRLRQSGNHVFADVTIAVPRAASFAEAHAISEAVEDAIQRAVPGGVADVVVHMEPVAAPDESPGDEVRLLARQSGMRAHDVRVRAIDDRLDADLHVEVDPSLTLEAAHALTARLEREVRRTNPQFGRINTHLEAPETQVEQEVDVTTQQAETVARVRDIADAVAGPGACHEVRLYRLPAGESPLELVLHCWFPGGMTVQQVHTQASEIERRLYSALPGVREILLHAEPRESDPSAALVEAARRAEG